MMDSGWKVKKTEQENITTLIQHFTREAGIRIENRDMASSKMLKDNMQVNGELTKKMGKESLH